MEKTHIWHFLQVPYRNEMVGKFSLNMGEQKQSVDMRKRNVGDRRAAVAGSRSPIQINLWASLRERKPGCIVKGPVPLLPDEGPGRERVMREEAAEWIPN